MSFTFDFIFTPPDLCHLHMTHFSIASIPLRSHSYSAERSDLALTLPKCKSTCRALEFSGDGGQLFSGWADGSLRIHSMETGALKRRLPAAHPTGVYSVLPLTEKLMASGDDDGTVKCEIFGVGWDEPSGWDGR